MKHQPIGSPPSSTSHAASAKPHPQPAPVRSASTVAGVERLLPPTPPALGNVNFTLMAPQAKQVSLCGEFNQWTPTSTPLRRRGDGRWEAILALGSGLHEYKYVVDGQWTHDPKAQEQVPNPHGSLNSVVVVRV